MSAVGGWQRLRAALTLQWRELGGLGRVALLGVVLSLALAVGLGFSIERAAERHILDARMDLLGGVVDDLSARGLVPSAAGEHVPLERLDEAVSLRLLGGETVRVKVWAADGTIVYSDAEGLIGRRFEFGPGARAAMAGEPSVKLMTPIAPEHEYEREMGRLLEFYLPVRRDDGEVVGLFEVYQRPDALKEALARIRRNVWVSIGSGLAVLGVFLGSLTFANARELNRRRRQSERLFTELVSAEDDERRQVVGALHDDVGQPLYRLLYGLQGCRARLDQDDPIAAEIAGLEQLVRGIDRTLRTELRHLHRGLLDRVDLPTALEELAATTREETGLEVALHAEVTAHPEPLVHAALFRAAQEALTNVRKHAGASRVAIRLREADTQVVLEVVDDGRGVAGDEGLGLTTTRERLAAIGGGLALETANGRGTRLTAWVPTATGAERS